MVLIRALLSLKLDRRYTLPVAPSEKCFYYRFNDFSFCFCVCVTYPYSKDLIFRTARQRLIQLIVYSRGVLVFFDTMSPY